MAEQETRPTETRPTVWDPFRELERFEHWNPFRDLAAGASPFDRLAQLWEERGGRSGLIAPAIDVSESDDHYAVTVEVPGANRDDITVEVENDVLSIRGEKKSEREEKKEQRRWSERTYGSFVRSFRLPPNADGERISASFDNGVLTLEIPKKEGSKPTVISVE